MVERLGELDVDGRTDRAGRQRHVRRLQNADAANKIRADGAEVDLATAGRGRDAAAVIQRGVEVAAKAANGDAGRLATGTGPLDRDAGQALERGRDVGIGKLTNVFGGDRVNDAGRGSLDVEVALQGATQAGDDDVGGGRIARGRRLLSASLGAVAWSCGVPACWAVVVLAWTGTSGRTAPLVWAKAVPGDTMARAMSGETPAIKVRRETNAATKQCEPPSSPLLYLSYSCAIDVLAPYHPFDDSMLAL